MLSDLDKATPSCDTSQICLKGNTCTLSLSRAHQPMSCVREGASDRVSQGGSEGVSECVNKHKNQSMLYLS